MNIRDRKALKAAAAQALQQSTYDPKKLALIHTGAAALFLLVALLADMFLRSRLDSYGGLDGLETRTVLETVRSLLQMSGDLVLPFWTVGFLHSMLRISRGQEAGILSLTEGFRRFGPVLRLNLLQGVLYMGVALFCLYPSTALFMLTPLSGPMEEYLLESGLDLFGNVVMDEALINGMMEHIVPLLVIYFSLFAAVAIPLFYRLRVAEFVVMDVPGTGALAALRISAMLMRRNRMAFFKLDLSFWWFYLLDGLITLICYGDVLLQSANMALPLSAEWAAVAVYAVYLCVQVLFYWQFRCRVDATYAVAYDVLRAAEGN